MTPEIAAMTVRQREFNGANGLKALVEPQQIKRGRSTFDSGPDPGLFRGPALLPYCIAGFFSLSTVKRMFFLDGAGIAWCLYI